MSSGNTGLAAQYNAPLQNGGYAPFVTLGSGSEQRFYGRGSDEIANYALPHFVSLGGVSRTPPPPIRRDFLFLVVSDQPMSLGNGPLSVHSILTVNATLRQFSMNAFEKRSSANIEKRKKAQIGALMSSLRVMGVAQNNISTTLTNNGGVLGSVDVLFGGPSPVRVVSWWPHATNSSRVHFLLLESYQILTQSNRNRVSVPQLVPIAAPFQICSAQDLKRVLAWSPPSYRNLLARALGVRVGGGDDQFVDSVVAGFEKYGSVCFYLGVCPAVKDETVGCLPESGILSALTPGAVPPKASTSIVPSW